MDVENQIIQDEGTDLIINQSGLRVLLLERSIETGELPANPDNSDVWVVNHADGWLVQEFLRKVIRSQDIAVYIKPIFLLEELKRKYSFEVDLLEYLSDGYVTDLDLTHKIPMIQRVNNYIRSYAKRGRALDRTSRIKRNIQKTFNYYYTRQKDIRPILYPKSFTGYSFPRLEVYYLDNRTGFIESRKLLREAFSHGWIERYYLDTCHLCRYCYSGFLNYREICPGCGKHDLLNRTLIHHFRCAHVAIESDFVKGDKLICPKCSGKLKNIGVDYDKPGTVFVCNNSSCNLQFQDAPVGVHCVHCQEEQSSEDLFVAKAYRYELTEEGIANGLGLV